MGQFISGKNSVLEAVKHQVPLKKIYLLKPWHFEVKPKVQMVITSKEQLDHLSDFQNHQGYVAELQEFNYSNFEDIKKDQPQKILILDHIQDPHNLGTIIRTANAAGIKHLIIPQDRAAKVNATVLKVASGGQIGLKIIRVNSLIKIIEKLKQNHVWIYASSLNEKSVDLNNVKFNYPMALIVGNENIGVSSTLLKSADEIVKIKLSGTVQSLNVSVATGVILFKI